MKAKIIAEFLLIYVLYICTLFYPRHVEQSDAEPVTQETSSIVFETAAHIPVEDYPDYTRVWFDTETDRAVYIMNNYVPTVSVEIGEEVYFGDIHGHIIDRDEQGITIRLSTGVVEYGMSGSYVIYHGIPIAFVSRAVNVYELYAVFF